ncbi:5308_t:CDS:2 [Funneliformis geosporum]|nr:5308_t:CDS:2 [Funneliformis geosporum]
MKSSVISDRDLIGNAGGYCPFRMNTREKSKNWTDCADLDLSL